MKSFKEHLAEVQNYSEATGKTQYNVGKKFKISEGSGVDSGKIVTIIPWFHWEKADDGTYSAPDKKKSVAIKYENGEKGFMYKNRLSPIGD